MVFKNDVLNVTSAGVSPFNWPHHGVELLHFQTCHVVRDGNLSKELLAAFLGVATIRGAPPFCGVPQGIILTCWWR